MLGKDGDGATQSSLSTLGVRGLVARSELCRADRIGSDPFSVPRAPLFGSQWAVQTRDRRGAPTRRQGCLKPQAEVPPCDWSVELERAETWGVGGQLLLVVINANHGSGTGTWDYVLLYACERGAFVPVLSRQYLYGAKIEIGPESDLWITSGVWRPGDASCCPSRERREHYAWNELRRSVVLVSSEIAIPRSHK